ncbi:MAG: LysE family translocator [Alphaproteobacteria bacterium]|nr:LysE family translocator [Alphaproteobacteria bacterium]
MSFENWLTFVTVWAVACTGVGPNSVTCATAAAHNGVARGMWSALGITAASLAHSMVAAFGFSTLMLAYSGAYQFLKWLGIAYLVWLGLSLWRKPPIVVSIEDHKREARLPLFRGGVLVSISNPQAALTYLAVFTQAIDPQAPTAPQLAVLVPTASGIVFLIYTGYVLLGGQLRLVLKSARRQVFFNRVTSGFYLLTASILALADARR